MFILLVTFLTLYFCSDFPFISFGYKPEEWKTILLKVHIFFNTPDFLGDVYVKFSLTGIYGYLRKNCKYTHIVLILFILKIICICKRNLRKIG